MSEDLYKEEILEHYWNPHNAGSIPNPTATTEEANTICGDKIRMDVLISDGLVSDIRFSGQGCAISQASCSMLTDTVKGKSLREARAITDADVLKLLGIPISPARTNCALLGLKTVQKAFSTLPS